MATKPILSSKAYLIRGRQRISTTLELGTDMIVRLYKNKDQSVLFTSEVKHLMYSTGRIFTSRLRLSTLIDGQETGIRIGVTSTNTWIKTLKKHGAKENPDHPEAKLDKIGMAVILGVLILIFLLLLAVR